MRETYTPPMAKRTMSPILLFPSIRSNPRNGKGKNKTAISMTILVTACAANIEKKVFGSFAPHPMHLPANVTFQLLAMGRQGKSARRKKQRPHVAEITITDQMHLRASRYCGEVVEVAVSAKRRMYWKRIASLMNVVLAQ